MPNEESKPKGVNGILQDGMSPEDSKKQIHDCGSEKESSESEE